MKCLRATTVPIKSSDNYLPPYDLGEKKSFSESRSSNKTLEAEGEVKRLRSLYRSNQVPKRWSTSTSLKIRDLDVRLDAIDTSAGGPVTVDALFKQIEPSFTNRVMRARVSSRFKLPTQLGVYEGKIDPMDHLDSYNSLMTLQGCSDKVMGKAFSATLKGSARSWFRKLLPGTIDSFGDLSKLFVANFMSCRVRQKNAFHLFTIH
ncbi:hypothetical protein Acr_07g0015440 [Actinidia rufa]|uniref:Retrotransposon gag domain-containing protein n=1 Tax=Actinidia rufa TaxID=165716 RepID=A0A7J0EY52_9ERIC|nr:hypothetical protein Acr_07g0015440 [Actinidia rufa]